MNESATRRSIIAIVAAAIGITTAASSRAADASFTMLSTLAATGTNLSLDAASYSFTILNSVVETTLSSGGTITLRNAGHLSFTMMTVLAKRGVTLEF